MQDELESVRVVVIDGDEHNREILAITLKLHGARVMVADSLKEAVAVLDSDCPDVLLCSIGAPPIDGLQLIRIVRARDESRGGQVPALAIGFEPESAIRSLVLANGYQEYLKRPYRYQRLIAVVGLLAGRAVD